MKWIEFVAKPFLLCVNIDNLIIEVDNIEIPILDGSSKQFCNEIEKAGVVNQSENQSNMNYCVYGIRTSAFSRGLAGF